MEAVDEETTVFAWKCWFLINLGVDEVIATTHADALDVHEVEHLVLDLGCPPDTAVEIVR